MPEATERRRALLVAALAFARVPPRPDMPELEPLRQWLGSWSGIGAITAGMARHGYDIQLTKYADEGWRANFYPAGIAHSIVVGSAWARTPGTAIQHAAWEALNSGRE